MSAAELRDRGVDVLVLIGESLGLPPAPGAMLRASDPASLPREPWVVTPPE